jgi:hypothetical protein
MARFSFSAWLKTNVSRSRFSRIATRRVRRPPGPRFLRLESLESRTVLSASPFIVNNLNDAGAGSLRAAVVGANATPGADVIYFADNLHGAIKLTSGDLAISAKSLTIDGPGEDQLTVSGDNASRVFDIGGSANVSIAGLTISEGRANAGGGILVEDSASLSISNCSLTDNEALGDAAGGGFGGGIEDFSTGTLTVSNSTFDANKAIAVGFNDPIVSASYIFAAGGAIDLNLAGTGSATISNSTFIGNEALGGSPGASAGGGALSNSSDVGATLTVTGCTLKDNAAIGAAGGDGTTNYGSGQGGGINSIGTLTVRSSTLTDNLAQGAPLAADVVPSQFVLSNSATAGGGIFCLDLAGGPVLIAGSTLTGNQAVGGSGPAPAIAEGGGISLVLVPSGLVTGCTVVDNVARGGAGNAGVAGADGVSGGIDMAAGSVVTVSNTVLIDNQAIGGAGGAGANGGAGVGGGVNVGTGAILFGTDNCSLKLTDSTFIGNVASGGDGGAGSNGGDGLGGSISVLAGNSASIDATLIVANSALAGSPGSGGTSGDGIGGGLYIESGADVTLSSSEATCNFASTIDDNIFGTPS